jgi:chitin deacetylase
MRQLRALHLLMVLWSVDTQDYQQPGVSVIVQRALEGAKPGAIMLLHDGGGNRSQTIAALPTIITTLRQRGYHLVTVPELLKHDPPPAGQTLPPNLGGD